MSQATIPDLPLNTTPPQDALFEISNSGTSESTRLENIVFGLQPTSEKNNANGYAGLDPSGLIDPAQIPDLSGTYQIISEKDIVNGYAGLDATGLLALGTIPNLPQSRIIDLVTDLAARELLANKVITVGTPGNDTNYPTEKATRDALDLKQDTLLFTPEDVANKVITVGTPGNDTNYPSEKAVRDALNLKEDSLGFTPENIVNKVTTVGTPGDDTNYPSEQAVREALDLKEDSLGFTPENVANKATDLLTPDNTEYPTTLAVTTFAAQYQLLNEKGAVSGYAGLDASQELLLANFPTGAALQVLRRNAANNALEFATVAAGGSQTPWTSNIDAAGFNLFNLSYMESNATNPAQSGAVRLGDAEAIAWRDGSNLADFFIDSNDPEIAFNGWTGIVFADATDVDFNIANVIGITSLTMNGGGAFNMGDTPANSFVSIQYTASNRSEELAFGNTQSITWEKAIPANGAVKLSLVANDNFVIERSASAAGAFTEEYSFNSSRLNMVAKNIINANFIEAGSVLATAFADAGDIRLPDLATIAFRNSTDDGNFTLVSDDPTITFNGWETIEFPNATLIDAALADAGFLSLDMGSGGILMNGFDIDDVGFIAQGAPKQAITGFLRVGNTGTITFRNFADSVDEVFTLNPSDQFSFSNTINVNNNLIKAVLAPVDGTDAANKTYVDNLVNGLAWKDAAIVATTGNVALTGEQTIDGVLTSATRILVKDQTLGEDNGVYTTAAGAWARTTDADSDVELVNMSIFIEQGVVNNGTAWTQTTDLPITVGTTVLVYAQVGAGAANPLTTKGDIFGYDTESTRIPVGTDGQVLVANSAVALGVEWQSALGTPITTKGDLLTFTTVEARLGVGITGQILSANAAQASGLEWINNDASPLTSKGDIYTFTTVNERLAVGTNGQVLSANAAQPTGLEWVTPVSALDDLSDVTITTVATGNILYKSAGDWVNLATGANGQVLTLAGGIPSWAAAPGGSQTPWTSDIDADGFDLIDLSNIEFRNTSGAPAGSITAIYKSGSVLNLNADAGDAVSIRAGGTAFANFGNGTIPSLQMAASSIQQEIGTAVASTGFMSLIRDGNYYHVTGTTTITNITTTGWQSGSIIQLNFDGVLTVTDAATGSGEIILADSANYVTAIGDVLTLVLDGTQWIEVSRSAAGTVNSISQLDSSVTVTDTGTDGLVDFVIDNISVLTIDSDATRMDQRFEMIKASTISNISSSVATLNNEGNLFDFNNTVATLNSIASTGWQAGSVIYLQFTAANATGIELIHDFAATNPQEPFWLLNETNYTVTNANNNQILSFIYDGTYWVQQAFGEITGGDVSSTGTVLDRQVAIFDGTTGKLITEGGQGGFPGPIIDTAGKMTIERGLSFTGNGISIPAEEQLFAISNTLFINASSSVNVTINGTNEYNFGATGANFNSNTITNAVLSSGITVNDAITWNEFRQIFNPGASVSGINVGEQASDPTVPVDGDLYYQTGVGFRARDAGAWITLGAGGGTGDVVGPGSATDNAISRFNLTTGKLIQDSIVTIDDVGNVDNFRSLQPTASNTFPSTTLAFFQYGNNGQGSLDFIWNILTGNKFRWTIQGAQEYNFTATEANFLGNNINMGGAFIDFTEITTPALPAANRGRLYTKDVSTVTHLFFIDSSGNDTDITPASSGNQTPWISDIDAAGFDLLFKTATPISMGQGATDVLSITYLDDTVDAGVRIGNTDGFVSITNESAVANDAQTVLTMRSGGATTIQNIMNFTVPVADDSGTVPYLRMNFEDSAGGSIGRPLLELTNAGTLWLEISNSTDWTFHSATTFLDLQNIIFDGVTNTDTTPGFFTSAKLSLPDNTAITWDGSAPTTPNSIGFTTSNSFQVNINNVVEFQVLAAQVDFSGNRITGADTVEFTGAANSELDGDSSGIIVNSVTRTSIQVNDVEKYTFDNSFLTFTGSTFIKGVGGIFTANTDEVLMFTDIGSAAVNYVRITNSLTAIGALISADGSDADVDLILAAKGTNGVLSMADYLVLDTNLQTIKGPNQPSAANFAPREGNFFDVTGTTDINFIVDDIFWQAGSQITLQFDGALTLAHNASTPPTNFAVMLLEGDVDFDVAAGDLITFVFDGLSWLEVSRASVTTPGISIVDGTDIALGTTTGTKIGTATSQKLGFFNATPIVQPTDGATLTNNVTVGGTTDTIADFTDLSTYSNDAATIRNDIYQLSRKVKILTDNLRALGLES